MYGVLRLLTRLALFTALSATAAAIVVARINPEPPARRIESARGLQILSNFLTTSRVGGPRLLNVATGRLEPLPLPVGLSISVASLSPWEEAGQRQIVGIGWDRSGSGRTDAGIVRMSMPGGEILDRLPLNEIALPVGPPCWVPGARAGVLYPGSDGRIYRVDFETSLPGGRVARVSDPEPKPVAWQVPMPGGPGAALVRDLAWPDDPRLGGRLLASLCMKDGTTRRFNDWQVWWLELDREGSTVVNAGRLLEARPTSDRRAIRLPNLVGDIDGSPALAYLAQVPGQPGYQLRVAPVRFEPGSDVPRAREKESRLLAESCVPATPAPSLDGSSIIAVRMGVETVWTERVPITGWPTLVATASDIGRAGTIIY